MSRRHLMQLAAFTLGMAGLLGNATTAKAEYFEYSTTVTIDNTPGSFSQPDSVIVNAALNSQFQRPNGNAVIETPRTSGNALTVPHLNAGDVLSQGTDIVALDISAITIAPQADLIAFNFRLDLTITAFSSAFDITPDGTGTATFIGRISGSLGNNAVNLSLVSFVPAPQSVTIGDEVYEISFKNFASPGGRNNGALTLHVFSRAVPEPGSLALFGIGGAGALGMFLRRRARASA